jgi:hypothetical protein
MLVTFPDGGAASFGSVSRLPAIDLIAGYATSLPLRPLRSPDQNDNLFENRSTSEIDNSIE